MKHSLKTLISVICICSFVICSCLMMGVSALTSGDFTYTVSGGKAKITGYTGTATTLSIPSSLGGYDVNVIGDAVFLRNSTLTSVTIPDTVTRIGEAAFYNCTKLSSITFGANVKFIDPHAFAFDTALTKIKLPASIITVGAFSFSDCKALTNIILGSGSFLIMQGAFNNDTALATVTLSADLVSIGNDAFGLDAAISTVNYGGSSDTWAELTASLTNDTYLTSAPTINYDVDTSAFSTPAVTIYLGDVNGDKLIDSNDVALLTDYLAGSASSTIDTNNSDINSDGYINAKDLIALKAMLGG